YVVGGKLEDAQTIYIAEGFATAASIHLAIKQPVVAAFNAGNLPNVARELHARYKDKAFVICGDDDAFTDGNPGRTKAEEAAKKALGESVFPAFRENPDKHTDFNDLHLAEGL